MESAQTAERNAARFLAIASALPLELQMTLCNWMFGSLKDIIGTNQSEPAFRELAKFYS